MRLLRRLQSKGFTLLEVLLVMVIIGVISGLAILSFKSIKQTDDMTIWMSSFKQNIEYAMDISVFARKNYGIRFTAEDLSFLQSEDSQWVASKDHILSSMSYPKGSFINLYIKGDKQLVSDKKEVHVIINVSSEITPFELHLNRQSNVHILEIDATGKIHAIRRK